MVVESNGSSNGSNGHGGARTRKLGNATSVEILEYIELQQWVTVHQIVEVLGYSRTTVDRYMKLLRQNDLIEGRPVLGQANMKRWGVSR